MSKRAEELKDEIALILAPLTATYSFGNKTVSVNMAASQKATALIDDYGRKERERCANRFREAWKIAFPSLDKESIPEWPISAILSEEDL